MDFHEPIMCPTCLTLATHHQSPFDGAELTCPSCGHHKISGSAIAFIESQIGTLNLQQLHSRPQHEAMSRKILSHYIRKRTFLEDDPPLILTEWAKRIVSDSKLPDPHTQAENLVLWLGETYKETPQEWVEYSNLALEAVIGTNDFNGVTYIIHNLENKGLIENMAPSVKHLGGAIPVVTKGKFRLSFDGWSYFKNISNTPSNSKTAFMAMPFGYERLNQQFEEFYIPAVAQTGFKLERVDTNPGAGSITNRMLVEIRRSKFLLCELTHNNLGAYWEAGFAEGLGKPVIYLCEKHEDATKRPHFDIRNHQTVFWTEDTLPEAMENLKAAIRATFPDEALMADVDNQQIVV